MALVIHSQAHPELHPQMGGVIMVELLRTQVLVVVAVVPVVLVVMVVMVMEEMVDLVFNYQQISDIQVLLMDIQDLVVVEDGLLVVVVLVITHLLMQEERVVDLVDLMVEQVMDLVLIISELGQH
jgi:hypothetical protein